VEDDLATVRETIYYFRLRVGRELGYMDALDQAKAGDAAINRLEEQYGTLRAFVETVALASSVPKHWREMAHAVLYPANSREAFHDTRAEDFARRYLRDEDYPDGPEGCPPAQSPASRRENEA
jgi:hypothetical protein